MFKYRPGKKINQIEVSSKSLLNLPFIFNYKVQLRSYEDIGEPSTDIFICVIMQIFSNGSWRSHDTSITRYLDRETKRFYTKDGQWDDNLASNSKEVIEMVIKDLENYLDKND